MSYGPAKSVEAHDTDAGGHLTMWIWGILGALTLFAGLWLSIAPENGEVSLLFITIDMSGVSNLLGPGLLLVGGTVVAIAMFAGAIRDYHFDDGWLLVIVQGVVGALGVVAAVLGLLSLLDRADIFTLSGLPF